MSITVTVPSVLFIRTIPSITEGQTAQGIAVWANPTQGTITYTVTPDSDFTLDPIVINAPGSLVNGIFMPITAKDDFIAQGNRQGVLKFNLSSTDPSWTLVPAPSTIEIIDNDTAGYTLSKNTASVNESGTTDSFTVVLTAQPLTDVVFSVTSNNTGEATASPTPLTFTNANWNIPQTVTTQGVDDLIVDGNQISTVTVSVVDASSDNAFDPLADQTVTVTTVDNDTAGYTLSKNTASVNESGTTDSFTVVLTAQPLTDVVFSVTSNNTGEATASPTPLTFTNANWNIPQTVNTQGVDDLIVDGNQTSNVTVSVVDASSDNAFDPLADQTVTVTTVDNDIAGITVNPTNGLITTEAGGTATFTVVLTSQPNADVTIPISSNDLTEGAVSPTSLTFTSLNWNTPQTVTVTGVDDLIVDGNIPYSIITGAATSTDANYNGFNPADVSVTNNDNDTAGITITQTGGSTDVAEGGATDTYTIVLTSQPTTNVTVNVNPNSQVSSSASSLLFTPVNWNTPQTVTVTAVDDALVEGNHTGTISHTATSGDTNYNNIAIGSVTANITDNDTAGVTITQTGGSTDVAEGGATDTYTVVLTSQPTQDVTINLTPDSQVTTAPTSLTFTSTNWNTAQTVTVTAVDDALVEGNHTGKITHTVTSPDTNYNNITVASVTANITDNDTAGITVKPTSGLVTSESGVQATFTIVLNTQPQNNVTIPISSSNTKEGTVSNNSVTFTTANWNTPQTITVTGVDDNIVDGDIPYTIITGAATSTDPTYNNVNPSDVSVINKDNDSNLVLLPDLTLTKTASSQIVIGAQTVTYTLNISNIGQAAASNITVSDALPSGLNFVTATATGGFSTPSGTDANGNLNFTGGSLAAGASATLTLVVNATNSSSTQGFTNTATVDPLNRITESNENNNSASVSFGYIAPAAAPPIGESIPNRQPTPVPNATPGGFVAGFFPDLPPGTFITPELQNNTGRVINGTDGNDTLTGEAGSDTIRGGRGDDTIYGYGGDNLLIGGRGNDVISGGKDNDTLIGTNANNRGKGERDVLTGNGGANLFVLGDAQSAYYDDGINNNSGLSDYALITDFNLSQDNIQLKSGLNYLIGVSPTGLPSGAAIFIDNDGIPGLSANDELIGILQGVAASNPSAITARFQFV